MQAEAAERGTRDADPGILAGLEGLAGLAGIAVRIEPFELRVVGKGGLCRVRGRRVILVDARLSWREQAGVIGEALRGALPKDLEVPASLLPYLKTGHGAVRRSAHLRPLAKAGSLRGLT